MKRILLVVICILTVSAAFAQDSAKKTSARHEQRFADHMNLQDWSFSDLGKEYLGFKKEVADKLGFSYGVDVSYMAQRGAPSGKQTAIQGIYYPYVTWDLFTDKAWGSGQVNFNYNLIRYWGPEAQTIQNRLNVADSINDYNTRQNLFSQLTYTHTLPGEMNWLSMTVGQFPLYNFDGSNYVDNQQTALINFAMSQNASSTYPLASMGAYVQAALHENVTIAGGYQDATNTTGQVMNFKTAYDGKYTGFGSISWTPTIKGLGAAQYSFLYYNQPTVQNQPGQSSGWSVNLSQNITDKWVAFGRANGSDSNITDIKNSFVIGGSFVNPLERNPLDAITLGVAYNRLSKKALGNPTHYRDNETAIELQWVWGIGQFVTITPDIQLYPKAALDPEQGLTTVVSLRTTIML